MKLQEWFKEHVGKRVLVEIAGFSEQSWRVYLAGNDVVVLVQPSDTKGIDQITVLYKGILRFADPAKKSPGDVVGAGWDKKTKRWIPLTRSDLSGAPSEKPELPEVPDHLPEDVD